MPLSFTRSSFVLATLLGTAGLGVDAHGAVNQQEIPVELTHRGADPVAVPLPSCSVCEVQIVTSTQETSEGAGVLDFHYDDDYGHFKGQLTLTVLLAGGTYVIQTIDDVDMLSDETALFDLEPGIDWSWAKDVDRVFVRLVPATT